MSRDVRLYLADIEDATERIQSYVAGMDRTAFMNDQRTIDAVVRNLEVTG